MTYDEMIELRDLRERAGEVELTKAERARWVKLTKRRKNPERIEWLRDVWAILRGRY